MNSSGGVGAGLVRLHSETVLIQLPLPDFSMPFNTLCLVCSVVAVLFGAVHKATTHLLFPVAADDAEGDVDKPPIAHIADSVKRALSRLRARLTRQQTKLADKTE